MSRSLVVDITVSQGYILKSTGKRKLKDFSFTGRPFVRKLVVKLIQNCFHVRAFFVQKHSVLLEIDRISIK